MTTDDQLRDCYRALELPASASLAEVRESYRVLSRVWHPDRFAGNAEMLARATARQQSINDAYQRLLTAYDAGLAPLDDAEAGWAARAGAGRAGPSDAHHAASGRRGARDPRAQSTGTGSSSTSRSAYSASTGSSSTSRSTSASTGSQSTGSRAHFRYWIAAVWQDRLRRLGPGRSVLIIGGAALVTAVGIVSVWLALATRTEVIRSVDGSRIRATALSVGGGHACAAADSRVLCWGDNHEGQAGVGPVAVTADAPRAGDASSAAAAGAPDVVRHAAMLNVAGTVRSVAAGLTHTCVLLANGGVWCWGGNHSAQLGDESLDDRAEPHAVAIEAEVVELSSLAQHTCAVAVDGAIYCWGGDADGQLGIGTPVASCTLGQLQFYCSDRPVRVSGSGWQRVSAGGSHTCAIDIQSRVYCWGSNRHGQLGSRADERCGGPGGTQPCRRRPGVVTGIEAATAVAAGASHSCALDESGRIVCWGMSTYGQTGAGAISGPALVDAPVAFHGVSAGSYHTCAVGGDGSLWCWGRDGSGELRGTARERCANEPCTRRPIRLIRSGVAAVDAGFGRTCIRRTDDRVVCWGRGELTLAVGSDVATTTRVMSTLRRAQAEIRWRLGTFARWLERLDS